MTLVQARLSEERARQLDHDIAALGLKNRSDAVREGLKLLHRRAANARLAREYDDFYGTDQAPISDVSAAGDEIAAGAMLARESNE
ncbi:MAG: ribbon-helix-helix protein, CopG family [Haloechinothrix sp.]